MEMKVYKTNKLFNLDLETLENIFYVNLGWIGLWIHPKLVEENGKVLFPIRNCNVTQLEDNLIISEGSYNLHYLKFKDRLIHEVYGLSYIEHFLPDKDPAEVLILSTPSNDIYVRTEQILDVNLNPTEIKNIIENIDEDEDNDY